MIYSDEVMAILNGSDVSQSPKEVDINTFVLNFGKYKGKTLPQIKDLDPDYIRLAKENITREPVKSLLSELE